MGRRSTFPNVQGWRLRFEFVPQRPISGFPPNQPVECRQTPRVTPRAVTFLYPRFRPSTSRYTISLPPRHLSSLNTATTLRAPYSPTRALAPCTSEWNSAPYVLSSSRILSRYLPSYLPSTRTLKTIRTMADPVLRTASPYTDPSVKGPRSQQLSTGQGRSLLQDKKSECKMSYRSRRHRHDSCSQLLVLLVIPVLHAWLQS